MVQIKEMDNDDLMAGGHLDEMCSGSEAGSYLRRMNFCITQL